jgi:NAD(P)-dependent dehydrogenase (short-subunit alcohol dehydrogenase family)
VAKGGLNQLTRELAVEWSPSGIRVNAIQPAQILTPALRRILADPRLDPETLEEQLNLRLQQLTSEVGSLR